LRKNYQIEIQWTAFPLHPDTPEEGLSLERLFQGRMVNIPELKARLKRVAESEGLSFGDRKMTYNSRLAQELAKWAERQGMGEPFHMAAFHAYFVDGTNIAKIPNLVNIAMSLGLPAKEAQEVLETRAFRSAVDSDWARSRENGITAVPTFMMRGMSVVGAQPYEVLERFMETNGVTRQRAAKVD
jgi:predicted DsbA family dithiol-disulfide isomerase